MADWKGHTTREKWREKSLIISCLVLILSKTKYPMTVDGN